MERKLRFLHGWSVFEDTQCDEPYTDVYPKVNNARPRPLTAMRTVVEPQELATSPSSPSPTTISSISTISRTSVESTSPSPSPPRPWIPPTLVLTHPTTVALRVCNSRHSILYNLLTNVTRCTYRQCTHSGKRQLAIYPSYHRVPVGQPAYNIACQCASQS